MEPLSRYQRYLLKHRERANVQNHQNHDPGTTSLSAGTVTPDLPTTPLSAAMPVPVKPVTFASPEFLAMMMLKQIEREKCQNGYDAVAVAIGFNGSVVFDFDPERYCRLTNLMRDSSPVGTIGFFYDLQCCDQVHAAGRLFPSCEDDADADNYLHTLAHITQDFINMDLRAILPEVIGTNDLVESLTMAKTISFMRPGIGQWN